MVTILIADDHPVVRHGIRCLLEEQHGWQTVAEAKDGREAVQKAKELRPHVAILDISMPELNGLEACRLIIKEAPNTRVLIVSMHLSEVLVERAIKVGASGYVLKSDAGRNLVHAVRALVKNVNFFTPAVYEQMLNRTLEPSGKDSSVLSAREKEVVQMVAEGHSNKEIAVALGISKRTVENHRAKVMNKLHLHSLGELIRFAIRHRIVEP